MGEALHVVKGNGKLEMTLFQGTQILGELRQHRKRNTGDFSWLLKKIYLSIIHVLFIY